MLVIRYKLLTMMETIQSFHEIQQNSKFIFQILKAAHGSHGLPRIIGGSDLEVHVAKRSKELEDWFRESMQVGHAVV